MAKKFFKKMKTKTIIFSFLFFLLFVFGSNFVFSDFEQFESRLKYDYEGVARNYTEKIYSYINCYNGHCENKYSPDHGGGDSKELFTFYGYDATCDTFRNECNYYDCSLPSEFTCEEKKEACKKDNSGKECINCTGINLAECLETVERCVHNKVRVCKESSPYGQSGSIKTYGGVNTNGPRTFLDGYDYFGFHWLRTGTNNPGGKAIGFRENTKDVFFNNNLIQVGANNISLNNNNGSVSRIVWGGNDINSLDHFSESDEYIETTSGKIEFYSEDENIMELDETSYYKTKIKNGLEINNDLTVDSKIMWEGDTGLHRELRWSPILGMAEDYPNPSKENKEVLFYCDPLSSAGSCP
jgi:hypothetical protein